MTDRTAEGLALAGFDRMWDDLAPVGRDPRSGGYRRFAWTDEDLVLREWFSSEAGSRGLSVTVDRAGNQWAWWGDPDAAGVRGTGLVIGSHLDSVADGGAFDGPLGVVSSLAVVDLLRARHGADWVPPRPIAVAAFSDEEGGRFGIACTGSRLLTGVLDPDRARGLRDDRGTTLADAAARAGHDVTHLGPDPEVLARVGEFVELHVEQGRGLVDLGAPVAVGRGIWPHGRWRVDLPGRPDHAGTTRLVDRDDPVLALAELITRVRAAAERHDALATVGKVRVSPGAVNAVAASASAWVDARGADEARVRALIAEVGGGVARVVEESWTGDTRFEPVLAERLAAVVGRANGGSAAPLLATGAGHDAGILAAAGVPTAMLFVRNPTGTSHSPAEHAERDDCHHGVRALAAVVEDLCTKSRSREQTLS